MVVKELPGPLMVFNAEDKAASGPDAYKRMKIYQATPDDPGTMLSWSVKTGVLPGDPDVLLDDPDAGEDDPALSDDGLILCYVKNFSIGEEGRLYCAKRTNISQPFSTSQEIKFSDPIKGVYAPELFNPEENELEIFFTSTVDNKIYRTACTVE